MQSFFKCSFFTIVCLFASIISNSQSFSSIDKDGTKKNIKNEVVIMTNDCIEAGTDPQNGAQLTCETAKELGCALSDFQTDQCITMISNNTVGPFPLCTGGTGSSQNTIWLAFIAGHGNYNIVFDLFDCVVGNGILGVQAGIYQVALGGDCEFSSSPWCIDTIPITGSFSVPSTNLIPGQLYAMFLDGWSGTVCSFNIDVTGDFTDYILPDPIEIINTIDSSASGPFEICTGTEITFQTHDSAYTYQNGSSLQYYWSLRNAQGDIIDDFYHLRSPDYETQTNEINIQFINQGTYKICIDHVVNSCSMTDVSICYDIIVVAAIPSEDFGIVSLCEGDLTTYQGPSSVDDMGINTDPNGDGLLGWQVFSHQFTEGLNSGIATNEEGCTYHQMVEIITLPDSDVYSYETAVCRNGFPIGVFGQEFLTEIYDFEVIGEGLAANGCDSIMSVNIHHLDIDGDIIVARWEADGVVLEFQESNRSFSELQNISINYIWKDSTGQILPTLINPKEILVLNGGKYTLTIELTTNFINESSNISCNYIFDYDYVLSNLETDIPTKISMNPNPAKDFLIIEGIDKIEASYKIYNISGQWIKEDKIMDGIIDLVGLDSGMYILEIYNHEGQILLRKKLVKE